MRVEIRHQLEESAQLIFQVENPHIDVSTSEIYRIYNTDKGYRSKESGFLIGSPTSKVSAGIIDVRPADVIILKISTRRTFCDLYVAYRVAVDFAVTCIHPSLTADLEECLWSGIKALHTKQFQPLDVRESSFREFIQSPHTGWIQTVIDAQIQAWKTGDVKSLIRYAPDHLTAEQLLLQPHMHPDLCLIYIRDRLSADQINHCLFAAPEVAVMYAFDLMNSQQLKNAVEECPDVLLEHALSSLHERHLRACALASPGAAFEMRAKVSPPIHALLLSYTVDILGELDDQTPLEDLQNEITKSFEDFPEVWIKTYDGDRNRLLATLQIFLELDYGIKDHPPLETGLEH